MWLLGEFFCRGAEENNVEMEKAKSKKGIFIKLFSSNYFIHANMCGFLTSYNAFFLFPLVAVPFSLKIVWFEMFPTCFLCFLLVFLRTLCEFVPYLSKGHKKKEFLCLIMEVYLWKKNPQANTRFRWQSLREAFPSHILNNFFVVDEVVIVVVGRI